MIGRLPRMLEVSGIFLDIRTDFRDILTIFEAFNDPNLRDDEKWRICLEILYVNPDKIEDIEEATQRAIEFLTLGQESESKIIEKKVFDWEQDEQMIFSAINKTAGKEVREEEYLHWWSFIGYFNETKDGLFNTIVGIRYKLNKNITLEKHEKKYYQENKSIIDIKKKIQREQQEEMDRINKMLE